MKTDQNRLKLIKINWSKLAITRHAKICLFIWPILWIFNNIRTLSNTKLMILTYKTNEYWIYPQKLATYTLFHHLQYKIGLVSLESNLFIGFVEEILSMNKDLLIFALCFGIKWNKNGTSTEFTRSHSLNYISHTQV